jgi:hypothetical protein
MKPMKVILAAALAAALLILATACSEKTAAKNNEEINKPIDINLAVMSDTMAISTAFEIANKPDDYLGQRLRISGRYDCQYYEPTKEYFHVILVADVATCCSQPFEFMLDDKDKYPEKGALIELTGVFSKNNDTQFYYLEVANDEFSVANA